MVEKPIRVLHRVGSLNYAGLETVVMNYYRHIDREKVQFDFIVGAGEHRYEKEITELGGRVYKISPSRLRHPLLYVKELKRIINGEGYEILHLHNNSATIALEAIFCRKNVSAIIAHSHNSSCVYKKLHCISKFFLNAFSDYFFACSDKAADWMFGRRTRAKAVILKNAIDVDKFKYNAETREKVRREFGIGEKFVVGHIAGFKKEKNHKFVVDVFNKIHKKNPNTVLMLVGDGPLKKEIEDKVEELKIKDAVIFTGNRDDVDCLVQGMDCFWLPSVFEGLGIVNIEAQTAGLNCLVSTNVPQECKVSDLIEYIDLEKPEFWYQRTLELIELKNTRKDKSEQVSKAGYNIKEQSKWLQEFYLKL